jgi:hypothetical protein
LIVAVVFLSTAGALVWANVLGRGLPLLDGRNALAVPRYGFPAALPVMLALVGGWWALLPRRWRAVGAGLCLAGMVVLNATAIWTIYSYYQSLTL